MSDRANAQAATGKPSDPASLGQVRGLAAAVRAQGALIRELEARLFASTGEAEPPGDERIAGLVQEVGRTLGEIEEL